MVKNLKRSVSYLERKITKLDEFVNERGRELSCEKLHETCEKIMALQVRYRSLTGDYYYSHGRNKKD